MLTARFRLVLCSLAVFAACDGSSNSPTVSDWRTPAETSHWLGTVRLAGADPPGDCLTDAVRAQGEPLSTGLAMDVTRFVDGSLLIHIGLFDDEDGFTGRTYFEERAGADEVAATYAASNEGQLPYLSPVLPDTCPGRRVKSSLLRGRFSEDGLSFVGGMQDRMTVPAGTSEVFVELAIELIRV